MLVSRLARDRRVPRRTRLWLGAAGVYLASPIDLIPDFIPVLGYLDDLILVPLGIALVLRMIPEPVMRDARDRAQTLLAEGRPTNRLPAAIIVGVWVLLALLLMLLVLRALRIGE